MAVQYPLINGVRHSWSSIEIETDDDIQLGIMEISYKDKLEPGEVHGAGIRPIAFTVGTAGFEGSFSILLEEFNALVTKLGAGWKAKQFNIVVKYDESGSGLSTIVDTLVGCRIVDTDASEKYGSEASMRKCSMKMLDVLWNGVSAIPAQPTINS